MKFQDQTAIVTGAARGIGRSICLELARQGCNVAFNYAHSVTEAERLVAELTAMGRLARSYQVDAVDHSAVEFMVRQVKETFGRLDLLVNNAGIIRDKLILRMTESEWDVVIATNLKSAFNFSKASLPILLKARSGSILNITSVSGIVGMVGQANYSASKAGMIGLTKALAKEVASRGVNVNALALGLIDTDMTRNLSEEYRSKALESIPLGRFGTVEEVGRIAAFLLSEDARYMTGQVVQVDGGFAI